MAAPSILTQGTTFTIDDESSTPVTIDGIQSISGIGSGEASQINTTTLASTAKEFRMGLQDFGTFTINYIWNPDDDGQAAMQDAMDKQEQRTFIVTLPSSNPSVTLNVWTAEVFVLKMEATGEADGIWMGTSTVRVTGEPVWS